MAYKKYREMKVYEASGYQYKRTPSIVLKGQWLSELGFDIGEQIEVKCEDGRLIITKASIDHLVVIGAFLCHDGGVCAGGKQD